MSDSRTWAEDQDNEGGRKMRPGDGWDLAIKDGSISVGRTSMGRSPTDEYLSADAARKMSDKARALNGDYLRKETLEIFNLIKMAAGVGKSSITINGSIDPVVRRRIESLSYVVTTYACDQRDQRDMGSTTIT